MSLQYIPPSESKLTVEKEVREKPSVKELTKIESPGRSISEDISDEDNFERKKKRKKIREKSAPSEIEFAKKDAILIITEKPQAALKIASALGNAKKYSENNVPFYELERDNKKIIVASSVGHLFNLVYAKGERGWPIFKMEWAPSFKKIPFTKKYYELIKKLSRRAKEIIIATDYDNEGEVIGWNVLRFIINIKDAKRMKFSTLTKDELQKAYENPLPTLDWGQAYAGETRHYVDWLYGINLSRALMSAIKKTGYFKILSIGRVQGPALKIIVDREKEISNFVSQPYWQVFAIVNNQSLKYVKDIFDKNELENFKNIKEGEAKTVKKTESIEPPHPFDLTTLQREAYAWYKISPSKTLQIAQSLYLDGLISYPRTSSQKIPESINPKKILKELEARYPEVSEAKRDKPVEGKKSDPAHPSIFPTGEFKVLNEDEEKIYNLIVKRFISVFYPDAQVVRTNISLISNDKEFVATGIKIVNNGWMKVYPTKIEENSIGELNGKVNIDEIKFVEKETQPPKRYTPASLITLLEKKNLGTKTTRSLIVDTLFNRGYLKGTSIKATPLGIKLIESLEKYSPIIIDENLTRDLEEKMEDILETKENDWEEKERNVLEIVKKLITDISKEFATHEKDIGHILAEATKETKNIQKQNNIIMLCPICKKGNLIIKYAKKIQKYFAACERYPECKATYNLPPNAFIMTTEKKSPEGLPIMIALRKGKRPWEFVFNPNYKKDNLSKNS